MRNHSILSVALSMMALSLTACKMVKNMEEMHDATVGMAETTEKMAEGMDTTNAGMKKTNTGMDLTNAQTAHLGKIARHGQSRSDLRRPELEALKKDHEMAGKLEHAGVYYKALEFNQYNPAIDAPSVRLKLFKDAMDEYFKVIASLKKNDKTGATGMSNAKESLYALAATMHKTDVVQEDYSEAFDFPLASMYDLLIEGIANAKPEVPLSGKQPYLEEVGRWIDNAVYMMNLRYNFLTAMAFSDAAGEPGMLEKGKFLIKTKLFGSSWEPVFRNRIKDQVKYAWQKLDYALDTQRKMKALGYDLEPDATMASFLEHMEWNEGRMDSASDPEKSIYLAKFKAAADEYVGQYKAYEAAKKAARKNK